MAFGSYPSSLRPCQSRLWWVEFYSHWCATRRLYEIGVLQIWLYFHWYSQARNDSRTVKAVVRVTLTASPLRSFYLHQVFLFQYVSRNRGGHPSHWFHQCFRDSTDLSLFLGRLQISHWELCQKLPCHYSDLVCPSTFLPPCYSQTPMLRLRAFDDK